MGADLELRELDHGFKLAVERMPGVESCGLTWLLPVGAAGDPDGAAGEGASTLLAEYLLRGAGEMDSRAHSDALDLLGVQRRTGASSQHLMITATLLSRNLERALPLIAGMVTAPRLDAAHLEAVRSLALQALEGLDDEPQHLAMVRLVEHHLPAPWNRSGYGHAEGLKALTPASLRAEWSRRARPGGSILAVAGAVDAAAVEACVRPLLRGWSGACAEPVQAAPPRYGTHHEEAESAQSHLAMGLWAPEERRPEAVLHRLAVRILGGESSSRLVTEVREKRGLCYSVGASVSQGRDRGMTTIYAGSTPERAGTTLAQIRTELDRFGEGITRHEFDRAMVGYRSRLVMQGESASARAAAIATDVHRLGRPRSLHELAAEAAGVTFEAVDSYVRGALRECWQRDRTLVVVGPQPLE